MAVVTESMRVLHMMDSAGIFGAEVMLLTLARAQRESGIDAQIGAIQTPAVFDTASDPLANRARELALPVVDIVTPARALIRGSKTLGTQLDAIKPDIIHAHGYKADILLATLSLIRKLPPLVSTLHGWTAAGNGGAISVYEQLDRLALRRMQQVVVVSEAQLEHPGLKKIDAGKLSCIENGTDLHWRDNLPLAANDARLTDYLAALDANSRLIVAIGRLAPEKGYAELIESFRQLLDQHHDLHLIIAGEGRLRPELERQIRAAGLGHKVLLTGYLNRIDLLLDKASCLAQPSFTEGLPITLLEAMGRKIPIVASRVGGIPALLEAGGAGTLIPAGDTEALRTGIHNVLINQPDIASKTARAQALFNRNYSAARMSERYQSIYATCVGK